MSSKEKLPEDGPIATLDEASRGSLTPLSVGKLPEGQGSLGEVPKGLGSLSEVPEGLGGATGEPPDPDQGSLQDDSISSSGLDDEETTSDETEAEDSDDDENVVKPAPPEVEEVVIPELVTSEMMLLQQSELSLLGVASEEFLLEYLDKLPLVPPTTSKREHVLGKQHRYEVPPQSPRLALLEVHTSPLIEDTPIVQDPRLANWERWLADRKRQHRRFSRAPAALAMNSGEDARYLIERKKVLDYTRIPAPPDHFRGGPEFWKMPSCLPERGIPEEPQYFAQMSPPERGIIPPVEYVGVPEHIRKEKEVFGKPDRRSPRDIWSSSSYLKERKTQLKEELELVERHEPDMRELVIVGNYWKNLEMSEGRDLPVVTVSEEPGEMAEVDELTASLIRDEREGAACLRVQGRDFHYIETPRSREDPVSFRMSFASPPGRIQTSVFRLENRGTVKVRYSWRRSEPRKLDFLVEVPMRTDACAQHFFFNKNHDLLLPGQVFDLRVMFRSHHPGVFQESWALSTEPRFVEDSFALHLWGVSPPNDAHDELRRLRGHVEQRVQKAMARDAIYAALGHTKHRHHYDPPYKQNFLIEEKFLHVNPGYNFDGELVKTLCEIHDVIATFADLKDWDLKIPSLRQIIIEHSEGERRQNHLETLSEVAMRLRKNTNVTRDGRLRQYSCVYNLLCNFVNVIDREGRNLKAVYGLVDRPEVKFEERSDPKKGKRSRSRQKGKRRDSSSSSSLAMSEDSVPSSEAPIQTLSAHRLQSLTALFTPAAGYYESTTQLFAPLITPNLVEPEPSIPLLPILLTTEDELSPIEVDEELVRRVYRQSLFVMVREALCHTVDHISAVLQSYKQI